MKKFLKFVIVLLLIVIIAASVALGMFYKKATPTLIVDLSKKQNGISQTISEIDPKYKTEEEISENKDSLTSQWWVSKWYNDMSEGQLKSFHYDMTDTDLKTYLKNLLKMDFDGFTGFAAADEKNSKIEILCTGSENKSNIILYGFAKTKLSGKMLEIKIEQALYKGESDAVSLPILLRHYTASAGDKLEIELDKPDKESVYYITICEADNTAAPAYENECAPQNYLLDGELSTEITVKKDGVYRLDYLYEKAEKDADFEVYIDGKPSKSGTFTACKGDCSAYVEAELKKGEHKVKIEADDVLPNIKKLTVTADEDANAVYILENTFENGVQKYVIAIPKEAQYSITSTDLKNDIQVNSQTVKINELGGATVQLKQGFNQIQFNTNSKIELIISKTE